MMTEGIITIAFTDAVLFLIIHLADSAARQKRVTMPLRYAVMLLLFCCVAHYGATATAASAIITDVDRWVVLVASAGFGLVPICAYVNAVFRHPEVKRRIRRRAYTQLDSDLVASCDPSPAETVVSGGKGAAFRELIELRRQGALTDAEFEAQKARLMSE